METTKTVLAAKKVSLKSIANKDLKKSLFSLSKLCKLCAIDENKIIQNYINEKHPQSTFKASQITTKLVGKLATEKQLNNYDKNGVLVGRKELFTFWFILSIVDKHIKAGN
jgi:hypothetical protein